MAATKCPALSENARFCADAMCRRARDPVDLPAEAGRPRGMLFTTGVPAD
jgi:hypothetical protein